MSLLENYHLDSAYIQQLKLKNQNDSIDSEHATTTKSNTEDSKTANNSKFKQLKDMKDIPLDTDEEKDNSNYDIMNMNMSNHYYTDKQRYIQLRTSLDSKENEVEIKTNKMSINMESVVNQMNKQKNRFDIIQNRINKL
eukprot:CAMPEP_0116935240 /NCGR_PEP_ID=MMETSP0467-20121206/30148_1 /TAXON_ID=283647 /ORGANISM="Mesodinium pulex, Strain SPMC105" /LENGTH=138 /DNA_ID=CAMNT_0004616541 /DNA_START=1931 /DNA_END=2347 /DNA_ORIENTATION=-